MYTTAGSLPTTFEVGGLHLGIGQKFGPGAGECDASGLHHITAMGKPQRVMGVLLDKEHSHILSFVDFADDTEDLPDDQRRQTERRFVEQQEARPAHQRPRDRQHLLLAAREGAATLSPALMQDRKQAENASEI